MNKKRALLSVSDRTGLLDLAKGLLALKYEILSTGGTAAHLMEGGVPVTLVSQETSFPEVFGGRVKTLHPKLFGGILYDRSEALHRREAEQHEIPPIDLVVVNLYPFEETVAAGGSFPETIEKIDVGGPSLLRAAAKNHAHVAVLCDPADYRPVFDELNARGGELSEETKRRLAAKVFRRTAAYDAAIATWFAGQTDPGAFPDRIAPAFTLVSTLRYGENPHQKAAFYADPAAAGSSLARFVVHQGKELSYNNLLDADAALFTTRSAGAHALTIVKHRIPSGVAVGATFQEAFEKAWASDPVAGFGGVVAYAGSLDAASVRAIGSRFLEVIVAHDVSAEALALLSAKPNLRVLTVRADAEARPRLEARAVDGGLLVQEADVLPDDISTWKTVTRRAPTAAELDALRFAFRVVRGVVSNAIVVAGADATYGIGGGRTSRVDACRDAVGKAGARAKGAVAASDAFFPFPDGLEVLADAGVSAVVQPGGSVKDADVIAAADARGLAMLTTGRRHFRH